MNAENGKKWKRIVSAIASYSFFILMFVHILALNHLITSHNDDYIRQRSEEILSKTVANEENRYKQYVNLMATVYSDQDIISALNDPNPDGYRLATACARIRKYASIVGGVENIYCYLAGNGLFYDMEMHKYGRDDPRCAAMVAELDKPAGEMRFLVAGPGLGSKGQDRMCCFFRPDPKSRDAIIISVNLLDYRNRFDQTQQLFGSSLYAVTDAGIVLYGGGDHPQMSAISEESFFKERANTSLARIDDDDGSYVYSYCRSDLTGIWFISKIKQSGIYWTREIVTLVLYFVLGIVLMFGSSMYMIVYKRRVRRFIERYTNSDANDRDRSGAAAEFRVKLLDSAYNGQNSAWESDNHVDIPEELARNTFAAYLIADMSSFDAMATTMKPSDARLYQYGILNIIAELLAGCGADVLDMSEKGGVEFAIGMTDTDRFYGSVEAALLKCVSEIKKYIGVELSFCLSDCFAVQNIDKAFIQAAEIREYSFLYPRGSILRADCIREPDDAAEQRLREKTDDFCESLYKCDPAEERTKLNIIFNDLRELNFSKADKLLKCFVVDIDSLNLRHKVRAGETGGTIMNDIAGCGNISEVRNVIEEHIDDVRRGLKRNEHRRVDAAVDECIEIINNEFRDPLLSIDTISDRLLLNKTYLGRTYKKRTGLSISNAITDRRLAEAARLLIETDGSVKQISAECGLTVSSGYLATLFKKKYGMTPAEYRAQKRNDSAAQ